jgi:hypothetical protein
MRIHGRILRPSNLAERRILLGLGVSFLRVPRSENPYQVARRLRRLALGATPDLVLVRRLAARMHAPPEPRPSPDVDVPAFEGDRA